MVVLAVSDAGQGLAGSFWELLAARVVFGVGFGALWTTGLAWLSEATGDRHAQALSLTVTTAGLGGVAGPAFAGVLVQRFGLAAPFTVAAAITALLAAGLALEGSASGRAVTSERATIRALTGAARERRVTASLALMGLGGLLGGVVNLLVPLQLHRNGVATASIGAAFGASAVLFICSSAVVAHLGERAARAGVGATAAALGAVTLLLVLVSSSTAVVVTFLLARGPVSAVLFTVTFPLGVRGGRAAGISVGTMAALLNIVWALSALVAPVAAGALSQTAGDRAAYGVMAVLSLVVASAVASRPPRLRSAES